MPLTDALRQISSNKIDDTTLDGMTFVEISSKITSPAVPLPKRVTRVTPGIIRKGKYMTRKVIEK